MILPNPFSYSKRINLLLKSYAKIGLQKRFPISGITRNTLKVPPRSLKSMQILNERPP